MSDKVFLDTNILVYSYSVSEKDKQLTARKLITKTDSHISTQVLTELSNTLTRKFKLPFDGALKAIDECCANNQVFINNPETIKEAIKVADKYRFSFYDSLIISAAIESGCKILYSEDMHHGQVIEKKLTIMN
ncbi:PIN domain-containing protein [Parapedobacter tibetensis]|uniref:PIN domain-containing protein n=1 Tax=Parapedobacter tibetensis TaxID=2972951 RepID=UPI00214D3E07|nr:PIN domain-containing protein [Parapedobacter tibetensis]